MLRLILLIISIHLTTGATIKTICPDNCLCQTTNEAVCSSYDFIKKLTPKQITTIINLHIKNAEINTIDVKLKYMKNLNLLDLSNNNIATLPSQLPYLPKLKSLNLTKNYIKDITFENLPKKLEILDLSYNSITYFPKDWKKLEQLKTLRLDNNPIDCDCDNLFIYEQLTLHGINMPGLTCHYPKEFQGISLDKINCSMIKNNLLNTMLGDDGGSGLIDPLSSNVYFESNPNPNPNSAELDEQFLNTNYVTEPSQLETLEEGSGDEGSGAYLIPIEEIPRACNFNCSTAKPVGVEDEKDASPPPPLKEQINIVINDLFGYDETTSTTTTTTTTSTTPITTTKSVEVKEDVNLKEIEPIVEISDKDLVETFPTNDTVLGEMERASIVDSNAQTVYIVVGLIVAFLAFALIYFVNKRRNRNDKRRRNNKTDDCFGEEMKPLEKPTTEKITATKPEESSPLLNGKNGKITDDNNIKLETNGKTNDDDDDNSVELRKPPTNKDELLTPQLERVTIKSGEIPDSIPKTPMLVHRQLNNEGEIVTTVISK